MLGGKQRGSQGGKPPQGLPKVHLCLQQLGHDRQHTAPCRWGCWLGGGALLRGNHRNWHPPMCSLPPRRSDTTRFDGELVCQHFGGFGEAGSGGRVQSRRECRGCLPKLMQRVVTAVGTR